MTHSLYIIQRTRLIACEDMAYYRFDIVNTLTYACVASGYSRKPFPPARLRDRLGQLNSRYVLDEMGVY